MNGSLEIKRYTDFLGLGDIKDARLNCAGGEFSFVLPEQQATTMHFYEVTPPLEGCLKLTLSIKSKWKTGGGSGVGFIEFNSPNPAGVYK